MVLSQFAVAAAKLGPSSREGIRRICSSSRQQMWAVPFRIGSDFARQRFELRYNNSDVIEQRLSVHDQLRMSEVADVDYGQQLLHTLTVRPEFVPFFVFKGHLDATFTASAGEVGRKDGLKLHLDLDATSATPGIARNMAVYAAFEFPTWYVEEALLTGGGEVGAVRIDDAKAPPGTFVGDFEMHPMYAYEQVLEKLRPMLEMEALKACRGPEGKQRWANRIVNLVYKLSPGELAERGVVLLPCYVCEYTHQDKEYRCFISGINGQVRALLARLRHTPHAARPHATRGTSCASSLRP